MDSVSVKKITYFTISKIREEQSDNKDSIRISPDHEKFAISDGVSGSSYSKEWADFLTEGFVNNPFEEENLEVKMWVSPLQKKWYDDIPWDELRAPDRPSYFYEKASDGSQATLLGGVFEKNEEKLYLKLWALGDTNLFLIRNNENILSFPIENSDDYGIDPSLFFSIPKRDEKTNEVIHHNGEIKFKKIEIIKDDLIICVTDGIGKWYMESIEGKTIETSSVIPWMDLIQISNEKEFHDFIKDKVDLKEMKNDDSTMLVMRF